MAIAGITANHHCLVRHHTRATMTKQTPMTISVLPMCDHQRVMAFQVSVRDFSSALLTDCSHVLSPSRGPLRRSPNPTITSQIRIPGRAARTNASRTADVNRGALWSVL
jgi:hypothetical protein